MSVEVYDFDPDDLSYLAVNSFFERPLGMILDQGLAEIYRGPYAKTMWHSSGFPVGCGGVFPETGEGWAFINNDMRQLHPQFCRATRDYVLDEWLKHEGTPVYARVDSRLPNGERWLKLIGFRPTGLPRDRFYDWWVYEYARAT